MVLTAVGLIGLGIVLLVVGAEGLVRGASRLAAALGVPPLVVGLTVVAFGTSLPELVVSVLAAFRGSSAIAVGNVVGSNVFNVLAVLGPAALLAPVVVETRVVRREVPVMIGVTLLLVALSWNGRLGRVEGALLVAGLAAYTVLSYRAARAEKTPDNAGGGPPTSRTWIVNVALIAGGLALLVVGGRVVVDAAVALAQAAGVAERVIAVTLVAAGTSLPELATSLVAAGRGKMDLAVGNVVGSNVFNVLGILGVSALVQPLAIAPTVLRVDYPVMVLVALVLLPVVWSRHRISRVEGALLLAGYVAYVGLVLSG